MQSLLLLGRQPALGIAELESLYGPAALRIVGEKAVVIDVDPSLLAFDRLGGSIKFAKVLTILPTTKWPDIEKYLHQAAPEHAHTMPEGKIQLGLSVYGLNDLTPSKLIAAGLSLKKAIRKTGRSVRLIPNKELELSSAQVLHNHLTGITGWELVFVRDGEKTIIAQTVRIQDITSYTLRDRERPMRDAKVGMLPPKLAQTIINLATGTLPEASIQAINETQSDVQIPVAHFAGIYLLDPFCGTGVILQEATLMGYEVAGSDSDQRMVDYTHKNLMWLLNQPICPVSRPAETLGDPDWTYFYLELGDATNHQWHPIPTVIASEAYLGRPFTHPPDPATLAQTVSDCNLIIKKFLRNIHAQIAPATRFCLAIPAWQVKANQFKHLPLIDQIGELGYNRVSFEHVAADQLIYYRPGQIVARELLVLTRK